MFKLKVVDWLRGVKQALFTIVTEQQKQTMLLQELLRLQLLAAEPHPLAEYENQLYSQNGEDGVLLRLLDEIDTKSKTFLEIGVDALVNNTLVLVQDGWSGSWVDGDIDNKDFQSMQSLVASSQLTLIKGLLTAENAVETIGKGFLAKVEVCSLDIDQNTYHLLESLFPNMTPSVIIAEYNSSFPQFRSWTVPYDPQGQWNGGNWFCASFKAFQDLGARFGYTVMYCESTGTNLFLVRDDIIGKSKFLSSLPAGFYRKPRYFMSRTNGHPRYYQPVMHTR